MDASSRCSADTAAPDTVIEAAVEVLDSHWIYPFWAPTSIQFDKNFDNNNFEKYLVLQDINLRPIPERLHNKKCYLIKAQTY